MKQVFLLLAGLLMAGLPAAQNSQPSQKELRRLAIEHFEKRVPPQEFLSGGRPVASPKGSKEVKSSNLNLPSSRWFPGEWEEVQAVVVTCRYDYLVPGHEDSYYWYAWPIMDGLADYYQYAHDSWQHRGVGSYVAVPDTTDDEHSNVFFYVMDAIQAGGAEAWVRVENIADSGAIVRKLERMGLRNNNVRFLVGYGNAFWYRDCGPIGFYYGSQDSVGLVDFMYYPNRVLDDSLPALISRETGYPLYSTTLEWEGGNCVVDGAGLVLSSESIYDKNMDNKGSYTWDGEDPETIEYSWKEPLTKQQVHDTLAYILGLRNTRILPSFQNDGGTGHLDLYCGMIDENEFVFSRFPERYSNWVDYGTETRNIDTLCSMTNTFGSNYKCRYLPFPCTDNGSHFANERLYGMSYGRSYSNNLFVNNVIVQPCFSNVVDGQPQSEWDRIRIDSVRAAYPGYTVYPINVKSFDGSGGAIHCITKQIPAENPVRILHQSITGKTGSRYANADAPIRAKVTNRSGIASVKLYYRFDEGQWQETTLQPDGGNEYQGTIPTTQLADIQNVKVEYYLSATSVNGKTRTKPIVAEGGAYYTFFVNDGSVGVIENEEIQIGQFFPNPSRGIAQLELGSGVVGLCEVFVTDNMGRLVHHADFVADGSSLFGIDTRCLGKGVYFVTFVNGGSMACRKLVVE